MKILLLLQPSLEFPGRALLRLAPVIALAALSLAVAPAAPAQTILGSAGAYAVMAGSTVTNTGVTTVNGSLGAAAFTGAGSYNVSNGAVVSPITAQNQTDFTRAFGGLAAMAPTANLSGLTLGTTAGAITLAPGVYKFNATAQLTGTLILDAQNQSNAVWVFQIGSTFTTAANASVTFANLAPNSVATNGVFWQVGSTTTVGADATLQGNFLGGTTFSFGSGASIGAGRALTGADTMTLAGNSFDFMGASSGYSGGLAFTGAGNTITAIPEPSTYALIVGVALLLLVAAIRWPAGPELKPVAV